MRNLFPTMSSKPEKIQIFALIPAWGWVFILLPMYLPLVGLGLWDMVEMSVWLEIFYHVANGILLLILVFGYLKEEWSMMVLDVRDYLKHALLTVGLIFGVEILWLGALFLSGFNISELLEALPVAEMSVSHTSLFLVQLQPILGTIVMTVFAPISICALFYCLVFAPLCNIKPWLGYIGIVVATLIPPIIDIIWRGDASLVMHAYLAKLPIHLLACWSYQKTDNVWTPIFSLAATNLLLSIILQFYIYLVP